MPKNEDMNLGLLAPSNILFLEWFRSKISEFKAIVFKQICWIVLCSKATSIFGFFEEICCTVSKKRDRAKDIRIGLEIGGAGTQDILNTVVGQTLMGWELPGFWSMFLHGVSTNHSEFRRQVFRCSLYRSSQCSK